MNLAEIEKAFKEELKQIKDARALESIRVKYLGRKDGLLTKVLRSLRTLSLEEKKKIGPQANALRAEMEKSLKEKLKSLKAISYQLSAQRIDITMPGKKVAAGHLHPLTILENKIREIFLGLNFSVVEGPEAETEHNNFDALNIPPNHPARDMWDTFWLRQNERKVKSEKEKAIKNSMSHVASRLLLRTHTSPMQIRYMQKHQPPFQIIVPGRVFRFEATDASHEINFHQVEGLMVGENISLANFKFIIEQFFHKFFGPKTEIRFRPSYFPFVEPGLEVDVKLTSGKRQATSDRWLEVMGAGMVHPNVFDAVGYNPKALQGFAFGMGLERLAMIKYGIPDIRLFYSGDLRFINQF